MQKTVEKVGVKGLTIARKAPWERRMTLVRPPFMQGNSTTSA